VLADRITHRASPNAPRYLYVGRLSKEKALDTLLYAFGKVNAKKPSATLNIVGGGPERKKLVDLSKRLNLSRSVCFAGSKSGKELFAEYSIATCFVLPSRSEPWGLVVNESLSYGCPVIVSENCGCAPDLVVEGKTGFVHKVDDVNDLSDKMLMAPGHFSKIRQTAISCIELMENYNPDIAATQILFGIKKILGLR
jgi:glycosyltransferase involved in cell wall biosynthesis